MKKILFSSNNENKLNELRLIFPDKEILSLKDLHVDEDIEETGSTFEENALIKAKYLWEKLNVPVLSDDSGILVSSLNGAPGIYSARFHTPHDDSANNAHLIKSMYAADSFINLDAQYVTCLCYINKSGEVNYFHGISEGTITDNPKGTNGFAYDSLFIPKLNNPENKTIAEMSPTRISEISHRRLAIDKWHEYMERII